MQTRRRARGVAAMRYESTRPERPFGITVITRDVQSVMCVMNRRHDDLGRNALELHDYAGTSGVGTTRPTSVGSGRT